MTKLTILCVVASAFGLSHAALAQQRGGAQPQGVREATVTEIPGVVAAGAKWTLAWQGTNNADGIVGTKDGGLLFAQEQPSQVSKLDKNDRLSVFLRDTHGTGALSVDAKGRIVAVERTCTDPGRSAAAAPCTEPTVVGVLAPERKTLADNFEGKPLGRLNDLVADKKGGVYFTVGGAYYANAAGRVTSLGENIRANGIILSRDERIVYVSGRPDVETGAERLEGFQFFAPLCDEAVFVVHLRAANLKRWFEMNSQNHNCGSRSVAVQEGRQTPRIAQSGAAATEVLDRG